MKSNSESRVILTARFDAIQEVLKNGISFADNSDDNSPIMRPLRDLQEDLAEVLVIVEKQKKSEEDWLSKWVKHTGESADLKRLSDKLSNGLVQLCIAVSSVNLEQKVKVWLGY